jgi:hypothetical protein
MITYGRFKDGKLRIRTDGRNVGSCELRDRVPDRFGWILNVPLCETNIRIDMLRVDS